MKSISRLPTRLGASSTQLSPALMTLRSIFSTAQLRSDPTSADHASGSSKPAADTAKEQSSSEPQKSQRVKGMAEADDELRKRLEEMSGEGGAAGIEYEDGKPETMKRSVRNNMFRYI
ncbi:hypothetical protein BJX61DRAFT_545347 [Aspergillus egyptiacus]|nr:hypothetical protein BJX61DRAFT_545347 [Aspergillus egyptiacus]